MRECRFCGSELVGADGQTDEAPGAHLRCKRVAVAERERIVAHAQRAADAYFATAERVDDHPSFFAGCAMRSFAGRIVRGEHEGGNDA